MTSPPQTTSDAAAARGSRPAGRHRWWIIFPAIFLFQLLLHWSLLREPYHADEIGYISPATHELLKANEPASPAPLSPMSSSPLVGFYLATCRKLFGKSIVVTRAAMLVVSALALLGLFRLSGRVANGRVAWASVVCSALYPVFFNESAAARASIAAAALTMWGLLFYLPLRKRAHWRRRVLCVLLLALAGLAKETAALAVPVLAGWEMLRHWRERKFEKAAVVRVRERRAVWLSTALLLLALLPVAVWLVSQQQRARQLSGNTEYLRAKVETPLGRSQLLTATGARIWQATAYMNLYVLTVPTLLLTLCARPVRDEGIERGRIDVSIQLVFAALTLLYVVVLSLVSETTQARDMLPVVPLVILICVSTVWRRTRYWQFLIALMCAALVLGINKV